jgi:hypothetical protein
MHNSVTMQQSTVQHREFADRFHPIIILLTQPVHMRSGRSSAGIAVVAHTADHSWSAGVAGQTDNVLRAYPAAQFRHDGRRAAPLRLRHEPGRDEPEAQQRFTRRGSPSVPTRKRTRRPSSATQQDCSTAAQTRYGRGTVHGTRAADLDHKPPRGSFAAHGDRRPFLKVDCFRKWKTPGKNLLCHFHRCIGVGEYPYLVRKVFYSWQRGR